MGTGRGFVISGSSEVFFGAKSFLAEGEGSFGIFELVLEFLEVHSETEGLELAF